MSNKKNWQIAILILVIAVAGYYFYNEFYHSPKPKEQNRQEANLDLDQFFEFKVVRQDLTEDQIDDYRQRFDRDIGQVLANPDHFNFSALNNMAMIKRVLHDFEGARDIWEYISLKRPKNSLSFYNLGSLYAEEFKDNQKAEENYLKCLENSKGESGNEQYYRAVVDFYTYYYPEKKKQIERILLDALNQKEYKNSQDLMALLATYYQNNGQLDKALEYWQKILKLDPGNEGVRREIERIKGKNF